MSGDSLARTPAHSRHPGLVRQEADCTDSTWDYINKRKIRFNISVEDLAESGPSGLQESSPSIITPSGSLPAPVRCNSASPSGETSKSGPSGEIKKGNGFVTPPSQEEIDAWMLEDLESVRDVQWKEPIISEAFDYMIGPTGRGFDENQCCEVLGTGECCRNECIDRFHQSCFQHSDCLAINNYESLVTYCPRTCQVCQEWRSDIEKCAELNSSGSQCEKAGKSARAMKEFANIASAIAFRDGGWFRWESPAYRCWLLEALQGRYYKLKDDTF